MAASLSMVAEWTAPHGPNWLIMFGLLTDGSPGMYRWRYLCASGKLEMFLSACRF